MAFSLFKKKKYADSVFENGKIVTLDPDFEGATAIAVKDGRIMAIGSNEEMEDLINQDTFVCDLEGKYLTAGLIEPFGNPADRCFENNFIRVSSDMTVYAMNSLIRNYIDNHVESSLCMVYGANVKMFMNPDEVPDALNFNTMMDDLSDSVAIVVICEDGLNMKLNKTASNIIRARAEEEGLESVSPEFVIDTLVSPDFLESGRKSFEISMDYAKRGVTSVFGTASSMYFDKLYRDIQTEMYGFNLIKTRYFSGLPLKRAVIPGTAVYSLERNNTMCMELDKTVNNNTLVVKASGVEGSVSYMTKNYLNELCGAAADKGFNIRIHALDKEIVTDAFDVLGSLSTAYKNQCFMLLHECEITEEEKQAIYTGDVIDVKLNSESKYLCGKVGEELLEFYTEGAAGFIGARGYLGILAEGYYADFAVFKNDPAQYTETADFFRQEADMTVIAGQIVYDREISNIDDWSDDLMVEFNSIQMEIEE